MLHSNLGAIDPVPSADVDCTVPLPFPHVVVYLTRVVVYREIFIDNLLVRVRIIIEMILVDRPCATGV